METDGAKIGGGPQALTVTIQYAIVKTTCIGFLPKLSFASY